VSCCFVLQADADRQLEEQREKEGRALRAVQRAQKLLATQASMARGSSAASGEGGSRGPSAAGSRVSSAAGAAAAAGDAGAGVDVAELQQDVQLAEMRLVTRTMLQELAVLVQQHPGESLL
jgi:hypothetical protein